VTSDQKIANVEAQITACEQGRTDVITCPYCCEQNREQFPLCCEMLGKCVAAILIRKDMHDKAEHAERILEKVQSN
jgi:hypothetical protein